MISKEGFEASAAWRKTPERERDFYYSDPIASTEDAFFYLKDSKVKIKTLSDLNNTEVGVVRGYSYGKDLDEKIKRGDFNIQTSDTDELLIKKLLGKRIDIIILEKKVGETLLDKTLQKDQLALIETSELKFNVNPMFLIFPKTPSSLELIDKFNQNLSEIMLKAN